MSHEMAGIFAEAERAETPAPAPTAYRVCAICAERRPAAEVYDRLAKFRAIVVDSKGDGSYPPGDQGYRSVTRCRDAARCRTSVEAFGESWPIDDGSRPTPAVVPASPDLGAIMPAVEVAPDPPAPGVSVGQARGPEESEQAPADDDEGWF